MSRAPRVERVNAGGGRQQPSDSSQHTGHAGNVLMLMPGLPQSAKFATNAGKCSTTFVAAADWEMDGVVSCCWFQWPVSSDAVQAKNALASTTLGCEFERRCGAEDKPRPFPVVFCACTGLKYYSTRCILYISIYLSIYIYIPDHMISLLLIDDDALIHCFLHFASACETSVISNGQRWSLNGQGKV